MKTSEKPQNEATEDGGAGETEAGQSATEEQSVATARFETMLGEQDMQLNVDGLVCDLRDIILEQFKHRPKVWSAHTQAEQTDMANAIEEGAARIVQSIVTLVASRGQHVIPARLEKFVAKGGEYQLTLKAVGDPELAKDLAKMNSKAVLLVDADAAPFYGMTEAEIMRDAPELFDEEEPTAEPVDLEEAAEA